MSPKSSSSFLRQQQEFVADLLREMVNFLHLSSPCQCLPLIYVGQLKMESSVPKLNWGKNTAWEKICLWDMFSRALWFYTERFRIHSSLFITPTSCNLEFSTQTEKWKASVIEVSCHYYCLQRFFYKLSGHLHLVRSSTSLLTTAVCFLSKYHRGNILHWERYKQFPMRDGCPDCDVRWYLSHNSLVDLSV